MNWKQVIGFAVAVALIQLVGCSSSPKQAPPAPDELDYAMQDLKPKFLDCWGKHEAPENVFAFQKLTLDGYLFASGTFKYVDVTTVPNATKSTEACIERVVMDAQFPKRERPMQLTYSLNFSI